MIDQTGQLPSKLRVWMLAIRPKTLPVSTAGVLTGIAVAILQGKFSFWPALAALGVGLLLQIASNLANDVFDFERGTDTHERVGPLRVTQAGLLQPREVKAGLGVAISLAVLIGIYLYFHAGWPVLVIGISAIASAILYTGGPYPLGYHGFGDLFVFLFFGLAAVTGTYFVQSGSVSTAAWLMAFPVGLLVVNLLVVNNLRDIHTDQKAGKMTLAVRLGPDGTRINYLIWFAIAFLLIPVYVLTGFLPPLSMLTWLALPFALKIALDVTRLEGKLLNPALAATSKVALFFALLFLTACLMQAVMF